ncbi:MAG: hypothetical protein GX279_10465 [Clostridiaceae bacterium]|nr:hypothetical protein [Clostridiaceae bacterium]
MNNSRNMIFILLAVLVIALVVFVAALLLDIQRKKSLLVHKAKTSRSSDDFFFNAYNVFIRVRILKRYLLRIRKRIEILEMSDNWTISRKTVKFAMISLGIPAIMLIALLMLKIDLYYFIVCLITIILVHNSILSILIDRIESKLLHLLEKFIGDVRHHYHEHGMIDEAIYDTIEDSKYEMALHASKIYDVLSSSDVEDEIEAYNDMAPNKYFRAFVSNCYIVQKFGDKIVEGQSMFLTNLNFIKQEIQMELLKRSKLDYVFSSLSVITIAPIFTLKPLENWGVTNMPELKGYFSGPYGFVVQIVMFLLVILSYELIRRLKRNYEYQDNESAFMIRLLEIPFIGAAIRRLIYNNNKKSIMIGDLMKRAGMHQPVGAFYLRRILYAIAGFLVFTLIFLQTHSITKANLLSPLEDDQVKTGRINAQVREELKGLDRDIILKYKNKNATKDDIIAELSERKVIPDKELEAMAADRIYEKLVKYNDQYYKWWEFILSIFGGVLFYYIPFWLLLFKKKMVMMNMEEEVMQFHTIILMIMYVERISVEDILKWMEQFAFIFRDSIRKCLNDYESGDYEALEQLKLDEPYTPFVRVIENLQSASNKIPIVKAFDQLRTERGYYQEKRKQDNEILVNKKGIWGKMIAFVPMITTVFFYILLPFIQLSLTKFMEYKNQMSSGF